MRSPIIRRTTLSPQSQTLCLVCKFFYDRVELLPVDVVQFCFVLFWFSWKGKTHISNPFRSEVADPGWTLACPRVGSEVRGLVLLCFISRKMRMTWGQHWRGSSLRKAVLLVCPGDKTKCDPELEQGHSPTSGQNQPSLAPPTAAGARRPSSPVADVLRSPAFGRGN